MIRLRYPSGTPQSAKDNTQALVNWMAAQGNKGPMPSLENICLGAYAENSRDSLLHIAAAHGHAELCDWLIKAGIPVDTRNALLEETPFHHAVMNDRIPCCKMLRMHGSDMSATNFEGASALHCLPRTSKDDAMCAWLLEHGADANAVNKDGDTAVHCAAYRSPASLARLIAGGGDVHAVDSSGRTPMHRADSPEAYRLLLRHGADINARNNDNQTPIYESTIIFDHELSADKQRHAMELIELGANIYVQNNFWDLQRGSFDSPYAILGQNLGLPEIENCRKAYANFQQHRTAPATGKTFYQILAATPLADPEAPVDRASHMRFVFAHAQWKQGQAEKILKELQVDGTVSAAFAEELAALADHRRSANRTLRIR